MSKPIKLYYKNCDIIVKETTKDYSGRFKHKFKPRNMGEALYPGLALGPFVVTQVRYFDSGMGGRVVVRYSG